MLEYGFSFFPESFGGFPNLTSAQYSADFTKSAYQRVSRDNFYLDGELVTDFEKPYLIALNNFLSKGGDGFKMLKEEQIVDGLE
jgi:2',3'-cyclic-nucleotide 2'-phosphodiesterase (5'-nucleotidase family)